MGIEDLIERWNEEIFKDFKGLEEWSWVYINRTRFENCSKTRTFLHVSLMHTVGQKVGGGNVDKCFYFYLTIHTCSFEFLGLQVYMP